MMKILSFITLIFIGFISGKSAFAINPSGSQPSIAPDMYGNVEITTGGNADALAVPTSAVIDSGNRQVVLVDIGDGHYAPRDVKLGRTGDGFRAVLSGLSEGDKVVVNGNFLIDAESNLQSALKGFDAPSPTTPSTDASQ